MYVCPVEKMVVAICSIPAPSPTMGAYSHWLVNETTQLYPYIANTEANQEPDIKQNSQGQQPPAPWSETLERNYVTNPGSLALRQWSSVSGKLVHILFFFFGCRVLLDLKINCSCDPWRRGTKV